MKIKYSLILILLSFSLSFFSQHKKQILENSLETVLTTRPTTYKEIDKILKPFQRDSVKVKIVINKFIKADYNNGLAYEYIKLGNIYRKYSKYNKAIECHKKALFFAKNNTEFKIFSLNMLGVDYRRKNIYTTAINYNKEALEIAEKVEKPNSGILRSMEVSYNSIGNIYILLEQYKLAENSFKKAIKIAKKSKNKWSLSINNENIAKIKEAQDSLDLAIYYTKKALTIDKSINNHYGRMICYNRLGKLYIKKEDYSNAKKVLNDAIPIAESVKNSFYISLINNNLGWLNTKTKKYSKAKEHFKISLKIAEKKNYKTALTEIYTNYSEYHEQTGNYADALKYYKKHTLISNQLLNDKTSKYVNDLIAKYDSERKTNQIKNLAKQNEIAQLQLIKNRNFWIIFLVSTFSLLVILYFLYRQNLLKKEKKILTLEQDVLRTQMNPHFIFNALNSIKHYIINNEQKNAVHYLNKFSKLIRKILESSSVKEVSLQEELETMDLYMNIENIRFSNEIYYNFNVDQALDLSKIKVPPLVLQPFLENALWHGLSSKKGDKNILLSVYKPSENFIQIDIQDNGIGRKASAQIKSNKTIKRKSIGIELTKERLNNFIKGFKNPFSLSFNDLFDDQKNPNGTKVILKIPIS
jgi:tetratricopeptide (TPR) repeat protein